MANGCYIGVGNQALKVKSIYIGVNGQAMKVKKGYIGVGGEAKLFYSGEGFEVGNKYKVSSSSLTSLVIASNSSAAFVRQGNSSLVKRIDQNLTVSTPSNIDITDINNSCPISSSRYALFAGGISSYGRTTDGLVAIDTSSTVNSTFRSLSDHSIPCGCANGNYAIICAGLWEADDAANYWHSNFIDIFNLATGTQQYTQSKTGTRITVVTSGASGTVSPSGRQDGQVGFTGSAFVIFGGQVKNTRYAVPVTQIEYIVPGSQTTTISSGTISRCYAACANFSDKVIVLGGYPCDTNTIDNSPKQIIGYGTVSPLPATISSFDLNSKFEYNNGAVVTSDGKYALFYGGSSSASVTNRRVVVISKDGTHVGNDKIFPKYEDLPEVSVSINGTNLKNNLLFVSEDTNGYVQNIIYNS